MINVINIIISFVNAKLIGGEHPTISSRVCLTVLEGVSHRPHDRGALFLFKRNNFFFNFLGLEMYLWYYMPSSVQDILAGAIRPSQVREGTPKMSFTKIHCRGAFILFERALHRHLG